MFSLTTKEQDMPIVELADYKIDIRLKCMVVWHKNSVTGELFRTTIPFSKIDIDGTMSEDEIIKAFWKYQDKLSERNKETAGHVGSVIR